MFRMMGFLVGVLVATVALLVLLDRADILQAQDAAKRVTAVALDEIGEFGMLNESRYHRWRAQIAAGGAWTHAQGIQVQASSMGTR